MQITDLLENAQQSMFQHVLHWLETQLFMKQMFAKAKRLS
jgi:hypothetical protein